MLTNERRLIESANTSAASLLALIAAADFDGYFTVKDVESALPQRCHETNAVYRVLQKGIRKNFIVCKTRRDLKKEGNPAEIMYLMSGEARRYYQACRHLTHEIWAFQELELTPRCWLIWQALTMKGRCSRRQLCIALYGNSQNLTSVVQILRRLKAAKLVREGRSHPHRFYEALPLPTHKERQEAVMDRLGMPDFSGVTAL